MKDKALYHLMQIRARELSEHLPANTKAMLEAIQSSLKVSRKSGTYTIEWVLNQQDYSKTLDSDPFKFYGKGDVKKQGPNSTQDLNLRLHNWQAALQLWREIFRTSNLDPELCVDNGKLAFGNFSANKIDTSYYYNLAIAIFFPVIAVYKFPPLDVILLSFLILALLAFSENYASVHLRKKLNLWERLLVSTGAAIAIYMGASLLGGILVTAGLYFIGMAERKNKLNLLLFGISGVAFGSATINVAMFSSIIATLLALVLLAIAIIDQQRISVFSVGMFISGFIPAWLGVHYYYPLEPDSLFLQATPLIEIQYLNLVIVGSIILLFLASALWWIVGVQYYLLPWLSLFVLPIAALLFLIFDRETAAPFLVTYCGFSVFIFYRAIAGFFSSMHHNGRIIDK